MVKKSGKSQKSKPHTAKISKKTRVGKTPMLTKKVSKKAPGRPSKVRGKGKSKLSEISYQNTATSLPIIGIGASAGGLEALSLFLGHVPKNSGMAFVVVQHLNPSRKAMLVELLQRATPMPVVQIEDSVKVEPEHVYVIPPNTDLSILHGTLHLKELSEPHGLRLPINSFFNSLAQDQKEQSIGVILSGMGSDGTQGARAIKEYAGAMFVQSPSSAKFDGMPSSVVDSDLADVIAPAEMLAKKILDYLRHIPTLVSTDEIGTQTKNRNSLDKIILLLRDETGHDFSSYKKTSICRRIERRMGLQKLAKIADYLRYLKETPKESELLLKELLIGVTSFFRDTPVWAQLKNKVFPNLLAAHPEGAEFRVWVPACATGEEAYSIAMIFHEVLEKLKPRARFSLHIFATDIDVNAIDKARFGAYSSNITSDVSATRLRRFFVHEDGHYKIRNMIREMVVFAPQNLIMDPPFTKLDLLSCRNLLIYLDQDLQSKILPVFHYSLNPGGILLLGTSETVGRAGKLFKALPGKNRYYQRQDNATQFTLADFPTSSYSTHRKTTEQESKLAPASVDLQALTDSLLLRNYAPLAVLVNAEGEVQFISGKSGKYLEPASGKASQNIFAMAREGLSGPLSQIFNKAVKQRKTISIRNVELAGNDGLSAVDIIAQSLLTPKEIKGMILLVFQDVVSAPQKKGEKEPGSVSADTAHVAEMEKDLRSLRENMQSAREEMQTSQEELKSANEELQSTNEELQSTNEELTTSKEEMQSMNEELQTVNHELQAKIEELSLANDDLNNLFESTDLATLFLDKQLNVRRFTSEATGLFKLIPSDSGRPISDLTNVLNYPGFIEDLREVLGSLAYLEKEIPTHDQRWFKVRIMPYRTQNNRSDGVVITFTDITQTKDIEASLRTALDQLQVRFSSRGDKLEDAKELEDALRKVELDLRDIITDQKEELLLGDKARKKGEKT